MNDSPQMIKYKNDSFWMKIKRKIQSLFTNKKNKENNNTTISSTTNSFNSNQNIDKKEFLDLYSKVKNKQIELSKLDQKTLYNVLLMIKGELEINRKNIQNQMNKVKISLDNIKINTKEIELLKRNS